MLHMINLIFDGITLKQPRISEYTPKNGTQKKVNNFGIIISLGAYNVFGIYFERK